MSCRTVHVLQNGPCLAERSMSCRTFTIGPDGERGERFIAACWASLLLSSPLFSSPLLSSPLLSSLPVFLSRDQSTSSAPAFAFVGNGGLEEVADFASSTPLTPSAAAASFLCSG